MSSNMYLLISRKNTIIIDPHISKDSLTYINENLLKVDYIILTHEHYDHISGVNFFKKQYGCKVVCNKACAKAIQHPNLNFSKYFNVLMEILPKDKGQTSYLNIEPYSCFADIYFEKRLEFQWEGHDFTLVSTPGHSKGSICILLDNKYLFSGDSLIRDYPTITRLKGGSIKDYQNKTLNFLKSISPEIIVYPGHYESFIFREKTIML
jgi:hydroxyacylglutathione hydrolase